MIKLNLTNEGYQNMIEKLLEKKKVSKTDFFQVGLLKGIRKMPNHGLMV